VFPCTMELWKGGGNELRSKDGGRRFSVLGTGWIRGNLVGNFLFDCCQLPSDRVDRFGGFPRERRGARLPLQTRNRSLDGVELDRDCRLGLLSRHHVCHSFSNSLELFSQFFDGLEVSLGSDGVQISVFLDFVEALLNVVGDGC